MIEALLGFLAVFAMAFLRIPLAVAILPPITWMFG